ncbi:MAG: helix-turn-helix domain-containing protein, partial [Bacillota bacterium]|nr:helix-turn-helix domain-containing protein [Bacillota bacterium]
EKYYAEYKFKVINCSRIDDIEKCFKVKHKTVFYFEKLEFLDFAEQKKLAKIIESKYVYSSSEKHTDFKEIVVITSVKNDIEFIRNYGTINERLLTRLTPNSYAFKPLREYDKNVIIDWIENGINKFLSSNVKIVISEMLWKNNFYDLKKFVSFINEKSRNEIVEVNDLPKSAFLKNADIVTIKEAEKKLVVKTIEEYNKNITLCARSLGISRSTLYRKINDYNILL